MMHIMKQCYKNRLKGRQMKILIVYESNFGTNTKVTAFIQKQMTNRHQVSVCHVKHFEEYLMEALHVRG